MGSGRNAGGEPGDDLPDIIDVVMEMGRQTIDAENAPFPPPPAPTGDAGRLPSHLEGLAGRARDYVEAASSKNTRRAYAADWRHFASWCRRQGLEMLPPDPQVVIERLVTRGKDWLARGRDPPQRR